MRADFYRATNCLSVFSVALLCLLWFRPRIVMASEAGFREREHTADWALEVWAPDFPELLRQAARGLEALSGITVDEAAPPERQTVAIPAEDPETALVEFLNELLFLRDTRGRWFRPERLTWDGQAVRGTLVGFPLQSVEKEVKAATYHNLQARRTPTGWHAVVVVDV